MATRAINNIKLGLFVIAGVLVLILALYLIGKDSNLFGKNFQLKARFKNVQGLTAGSNVRFAGIQAGTVKKIEILSDTVVEVTMLIQESMKPFIHKNDLISISTDGLIGNKMINIISSKDKGALVQNDDILPTKEAADTEAMLETIGRTGHNIELISEELKATVQGINSSTALWTVLNDATLPTNLRTSLVNIRQTTARANDLVTDIHAIIGDIKQGKGSLGAILTDTSIAYNLKEAVVKIQSASDNANEVTNEMAVITQSIRYDIDSGSGTIHALLKDPALAMKLDQSLANIEQSTNSFSQIMEAIKNSFIFRGYFRKKERRSKAMGHDD